ncbi:unnamed protein product [Parnassius apollo]|uniref:(apollo) hypothetical protein n=1 Tax=Parnassius apollo TaxID=110799 RepID=A0A8S3W231_PARAO|nr:unnamed protein product [Parnassius apollo]
MEHNSTNFPRNDALGDWSSGVSSSTDLVMPGAQSAPLKRQLIRRRYGGPPAKRAAPAIRLDAGFKWNLQALANAADTVESGGKSPVSALNELGVRVSYTVLQQGGPAHCPSFTVAVTVADMRFEGWGHSKREARAAAARACLAALLARAGRLLPAPPTHQDFTSDEPPKGQGQSSQPYICADGARGPSAVGASDPPGLHQRRAAQGTRSVLTTLYMRCWRARAACCRRRQPTRTSPATSRPRDKVSPHNPICVLLARGAAGCRRLRPTRTSPPSSRPRNKVSPHNPIYALPARAGRLLPAPPTHQNFTSDEPPKGQVLCSQPYICADSAWAVCCRRLRPTRTSPATSRPRDKVNPHNPIYAPMARAGRLLPAPPTHQDFNSDEPPKGQGQSSQPYICAAGARGPSAVASEFQCLEMKTKQQNALPKPAVEPPVANVSAGAALFGAPVPVPAHKSPINTLYENYPGLTFICTYGDGSPLDSMQAPLQLSHSMRFKVVCQIKDQKFEGYGASKKLAKLAAARAALGELRAAPPRAHSLPSSPCAPPLSQLLADHVARLVNDKFNELMRGDLVHSKRKVLAGIVITINHSVEGARVIAVTTGTKCVSGEHMSVTGMAVNDCHAEVAARRCLQRHLYAQLLMYASSSDPRKPIPQSDLEPLPEGGYQLKPDRQIHLYVSTAPCGDGRIFSPHEHNESEPDKHPNRLARGQLRTKIESGEGTIPVKNCNNIIQTWDGVLQGERLLTMSCSDKAARWCVVGLQGALLTRLLRPVYLHALVLGSLLHQHHLYRYPLLTTRVYKNIPTC